MNSIKEKIKLPKNHASPHDWFTHECLSEPEVMKNLIEKYLSKEDLLGMNLKTLKSENTDFLNQILGKKSCDLLFSVQKNNKKSYIYLLLEQQSSVDYSMMTRMLEYMLCIYQKHLKDYPDSKKLPLVLPILLYTGKKKYTAPLSLKEASEDPERADHHFPLAPVKIIDLQKFPDDQIVLDGSMYLRFAFFLLKNARSKNILQYLKNIDSTIQLLQKKDKGLRFLGYGLYYIMALSNDLKEADKVKELFIKNTSTQDQGKIMSVIDNIRRQEREQGIEQGIEQGMGIIVNNMLKKKLEVKEISSMTGLRVSEIEKFLEKKKR